MALSFSEMLIITCNTAHRHETDGYNPKNVLFFIKYVTNKKCSLFNGIEYATETKRQPKLHLFLWEVGGSIRVTQRHI